LHRSAGHHADPDQVGTPVVQNSARQQEGRAGPGDRLERRRGKMRSQSGKTGRDSGCDRGKRRRPAFAAKEAGERRTEQHETDRRDGSRQAQHPDIDAEDLRRRRDQRHQRRLIDISEIRMPAADQEIQFVALRVVAISGCGMHHGNQDGHEPDDRLPQQCCFHGLDAGSAASQ
jgi:hypothetical protein